MKLQKCSCCGNRAVFTDWHVTPKNILWAIRCEMHCFITDFFRKPENAAKHWNAEDVQKALAALGRWERRKNATRL